MRPSHNLATNLQGFSGEQSDITSTIQQLLRARQISKAVE
jgi:hypothetical protein